MEYFDADYTEELVKNVMSFTFKSLIIRYWIFISFYKILTESENWLNESKQTIIYSI